MHLYKAEYHTLGCKLNFAETATIAAALEARGIRRASVGESADVAVVNTCSVTAEADKKGRQLVRAIHRRLPRALIVVTGCYAQLRPEVFAELPGVAVIAGNDRKGRIADYLDRCLQDPHLLSEVSPAKDLREFVPACSRGDRTRYFLKVQDGCDYWCTYCTIPRARGRSRSGTVAEMVAQARKVAEEGGREIVITGVNIGDFGKGTDETFFDLVRALDQVDGIERYRISSIEPNLLTDEMIAWVGESRRFMPHFHVPLQCGSDQVLRLMHRHYDTALFAHRIERIRSLLPDAFIGVDLIVGARGETEALFEESARFVDSLDISQIHVFPYSERPGTKALEIPHVVSQHEKHRRVERMIAISERKHDAFRQRFAGTMRPVLLEHPDTRGQMAGWTDNYLRVQLTEPNPALAGTVVNLTV